MSAVSRESESPPSSEPLMAPVPPGDGQAVRQNGDRNGHTPDESTEAQAAARHHELGADSEHAELHRCTDALETLLSQRLWLTDLAQLTQHLCRLSRRQSDQQLNIRSLTNRPAPQLQRQHLPRRRLSLESR